MLCILIIASEKEELKNRWKFSYFWRKENVLNRKHSVFRKSGTSSKEGQKNIDKLLKIRKQPNVSNNMAHGPLSF